MRLCPALGLVGLLMATVAACDNEAQLAGGAVNKVKAEQLTTETPVDVTNQNDDGATDDAAPPEIKMIEKRLRKSVDNQPNNKVVDYVLVLDNSSSMQVALDNARSGLKSVIDANIFNADARIGVMTTMPGDPSDLAKTHPAVTAHTGIAKEPGFLQLADDSQLQAFASLNPVLAAAKFTKPLCSDGFFSPYAKNASGHDCLEAAMQTTFKGVGVEDGIVSFAQMIAKRDTPLFRDGAEVNVIFISDVHAPGVPVTKQNAADLFDVDKRPTAASLAKDIGKHNNISKLSFHAIVPPQAESGCTEDATQWGLGTSYYPLVDATKGARQPVCETAGYSDFFKSMVKKAQAKTALTIDLGTTAGDVEAVIVDGQPTEYYTFDKALGRVTLDLTQLDAKILDVTVLFSAPE